MSSINLKSITLRIGALALLGGTLSACAHVKPEQLESSLAELRAEMRGEMAEGDQRIEGEVGDLDSRVGELEVGVLKLERELNRLAGEFDATVERLGSA